MKFIPLLSLFITLNTFAHTVDYFTGIPLRIITIGHPTLTMVADEIPFEEIKSEKIQTLINNMITTMKKAGGVGLAAPQVNQSLRLYVMKPKIFGKVETIINPKVEYINSAGTKMSNEGCLSIPGKTFKVKRYKKINISYYNRNGEYVSERATGFRAIVAQHEYDHLNGILISNFFYTEYVNLEDEDYDPDTPRM